MHRFLPGILLVQLVTAVLVVAMLSNVSSLSWWALLLPVVLVGVVSALWFNSISKAQAEKHASHWRVRHARDVQKLKADAERQQSRRDVDVQRQIRRAEKRVDRAANVKLGLGFAGVTALGTLLLLTELVTLGVMTITAAGSAMGGYLLHWRQSRAESRALTTPVGKPHEPVDTPAPSLPPPAIVDSNDEIKSDR